MPDLIHYVNVETKLFVDPSDPQVPSVSHPCIPISGGTLDVVLLTTLGYPYPVTDGSTAVCTVTQDGQSVLSSGAVGFRANDGLSGKLSFDLRPVAGSTITAGTATISLQLSGYVLVDTVQLTAVPVRPAVGCGCQEPSVFSDLDVVESYVAPSADMLGRYILYLGPTGQLIRGCVYKCDLIDGSYSWTPKTDAADDNLRVIEWQL